MPKVQCATKALIVKDGKILVIKRKFENKEYLDLPGGRVEYGLTPEENLIKEVKEEVNLGVKIEKIIGTWYFLRHDKDQVVCITYLCTPLKGEVNLEKNPDDDESITSYSWVNPEEFLNLESDDFTGLKSMKKIIKNYFRI